MVRGARDHRGAVYAALGLLRMGWVSNFLSKAVIAGFILGFALGIVIEQSAKLLGVEGGEGTYVEELIDTLKQIPDTDLTTLVVGVLSLGSLLAMRYGRPQWPRALLVVILATGHRLRRGSDSPAGSSTGSLSKTLSPRPPGSAADGVAYQLPPSCC